MSDTPTPDIAEQLRDPICWKSMDDMDCGCCEDNGELMLAASAEIERLRAALESWFVGQDTLNGHALWCGHHVGESCDCGRFALEALDE